MPVTLRRTLTVAAGAGRLGSGATKLAFRGTFVAAKLSAAGGRAGWRWWRRRRSPATVIPPVAAQVTTAPPVAPEVTRNGEPATGLLHRGVAAVLVLGATGWGALLLMGAGSEGVSSPQSDPAPVAYVRP